ncbi:hypothetical protein VC74_gp55 [Mycobacterium phage Sparky]|uniref:Uncharacterized protein n=2 Tax=Caudoviricetes TaxID=2731619 RepID=A0A076GDW0_9CAUD|nr:hypothetical protein VC74_gp55 [Mycobacterium phage Sparky]AII28215.1 hypothetical protein PBI_SPARKY_71 [Mycobacterium phage Sparky]
MWRPGTPRTVPASASTVGKSPTRRADRAATTATENTSTDKPKDYRDDW